MARLKEQYVNEIAPAPVSYTHLVTVSGAAQVTATATDIGPDWSGAATGATIGGGGSNTMGENSSILFCACILNIRQHANSNKKMYFFID